MPFVSRAQERWGHTPAGEKALGGAANVHEWDQATKGRNIPERVSTHANGGAVMNKGYLGKVEHFAQGGPVLGRTRDFIKEPDRFRGTPNPKVEGTEDVFGKGSKGGTNAAPAAKGKCEKPIVPRS